MSLTNTTAADQIKRLRNAARDVARSLLDDGPHTYVAAASSALDKAMKQRTAYDATERVALSGRLDGMAEMISVLPSDPWQSFTLDVLRCARRLLIELTPEGLVKEEVCVKAAEETAAKLCNLPERRTLSHPVYGLHSLRREDHGRTLCVHDVDDRLIFKMRGAVADREIEEALRLYHAGLTVGIAQGAEEIRSSFRLLMGVSSNEHMHGEP